MATTGHLAENSMATTIRQWVRRIGESKLKRDIHLENVQEKVQKIKEEAIGEMSKEPG